jgi:phosphoribosylanthranilate isomerase
MTHVKICGITRLADALVAIDLGAAALGFNFYPRSPRYISIRQASQILEKLPPFVSKIGVLVNFGPARDIRRLAIALGLNGIQLHGNEPSQMALTLKPLMVVKAFRVTEDFKVTQLQQNPASAILLDGFEPGMFGGTGKTIDWTIARRASRFHRIILSGGLTPSNVGEAIRTAHPYAVDVASGVESQPGKKDYRKMRTFFASVEKADRESRP